MYTYSYKYRGYIKAMDCEQVITFKKFTHLAIFPSLLYYSMEESQTVDHKRLSCCSSSSFCQNQQSH